MAAPVGSVYVNLEARIASFQRDMGRATRTFQSTSRRMQAEQRELVSGFSRMNAAIAGLGVNLRVLGAGASIAGLSSIGRQALRTANALRDQAAAIGITAERLQELRFAFEANGVAQRQADVAIQRFSRRVGEALAGTGELAGVLEDLNIELRNADGTARSFDAILAEYADAVARAGSEQERLRLAVKAFDSEGARGVNVLRQGADGLREYAAQARQAGILTDDLVDQGADLNTQVNQLAGALRRGFDAGFLSGISGEMADFEERLRSVARIGETLGAVLGGALDPLLRDLETLRRFLDGDIVGALGNTAIAQSAGAALDLYQDGVGAAQRAVEDALGLGGAAGRQAGLSSSGAPTLELPQLNIEGLAPRRVRELPLIPGLGRTDGNDTLADLLSRPSSGAGGESEEPRALRTGAAVTGRVPELYQEARRLTESLRTETERFNDELARVKELYEAGAIGSETYNRAVEDLNERFSDTSRIADEAADAIGNFASDLITDFDNAGDAALRLLGRLAEIALQATVLDPLSEAIGGFAGDFFGGLFGGGGGKASPKPASVDAPSFGGGGFAGAARPTVKVPAAAFAGAPHFATGGIPAIVHRGEGIFTPKQMENADMLLKGAMAGGGVDVTVNNYAPVEVEARQRGPNLELTIRDGLRAEVERGNLDGAMSRRYGIRPTAQRGAF